MILIDANVLINATRDDSIHHDICRQWLDELYRSRALFGFSELVAVAFLRILTSPEVYPNPFLIDDVTAALHDITTRREFMWLHAGDDHAKLFGKLAQTKGIKGKLVNDAWLAAIAIEGGYELISMDRDFAKFPGLRWRSPLDANR